MAEYLFLALSLMIGVSGVGHLADLHAHTPKALIIGWGLAVAGGLSSAIASVGGLMLTFGPDLEMPAWAAAFLAATVGLWLVTLRNRRRTAEVGVKHWEAAFAELRAKCEAQQREIEALRKGESQPPPE